MGGVCYDGEPTTLYKETRPTARVAHVCGDCERGIKPGDTYVRVKYLCEGAFHTEETCLACEGVFKFLWDAGAECLHHGQLSDYVRELSPHDFSAGGAYAGCPAHPVIDKMLAKWSAAK